jgi:glucosamine 6-phosphate synthetase-like amidotransferase/phosphosugar isomerase protein
VTEIETTRSFQEKMFEKIREQIGTLMTEEDLRKLVQAAMQKAFFENVKCKNHWGEVKEEPPVFETKLRELMREQVSMAMQKWINEHPEEIKAIVNRVIEKGIVDIVFEHIRQETSGPMQQLAQSLRDQGFLKS